MNPIRKILILCLVGLFITTSIANPIPQSSSPTNPPPTENNDSRLWNLQDADIISIINEVSLETGKNFVVDPRVSGKVSLVSSKPIKADEVYDLFLSVLEILGYSAIPSGNVVKIVPNMTSGESATRIASSRMPGKGDEAVVRVIPLETISANQLIPVIRPMLPQWSNVSAYVPGNVIIVLGRAANIQRIVDIIHTIDKTTDNDIEIVPLHHATATQLATVLSNLQNTTRGNSDGPQVSVAADERSNSLLLSGNKTARAHIHLLISQLDVPMGGSQGNTEVVYLRYLQAKNFAPILNKIGQNILAKEAANKDNPSSNVTNAAKTGEASNNTTSIQAEPNTNAVIITAPPTLMSALNTVIAKLDIRPAQVQVEGIIVQIDQSDLKNFGIQWGAMAQSKDAITSPGFNTLGLGTVGIIPHTQIQAVLNILQTQTGADILSTPSIVVLDNQKATLAVGSDVPQQTGQYATTGTTATVTPFNTITQLPVELRLEVTPQLNLGDAVRLTISLKNDSLQNPDNPTLNPSTNTSLIKNSVIVNSEDVLVIGGLISNNITNSTDRIPLLADLPIIGQLFQHTSRKLQKKNLMMFIKPTILHNREDAMNITNTKYSTTRQAQIFWPEKLDNPGKQKLLNILPPFEQRTASLPTPFADG